VVDGFVRSACVLRALDSQAALIKLPSLASRLLCRCISSSKLRSERVSGVAYAARARSASRRLALTPKFQRCLKQLGDWTYNSSRDLDVCKQTRRPASANRTARRQFQATGQPVSRTQASDAMTSRLPRYEATCV